MKPFFIFLLLASTAQAASLHREPPGFTQKFHFIQSGEMVSVSALGKRAWFHSKGRHLTIYRDNVGHAIAVGIYSDSRGTFTPETTFTSDIDLLVWSFFRHCRADLNADCRWCRKLKIYEAFNVYDPVTENVDEAEWVEGCVWFAD